MIGSRVHLILNILQPALIDDDDVCVCGIIFTHEVNKYQLTP